MAIDALKVTLDALVSEARASFVQAPTDDALNQAKARFVGKSGEITTLMKGMRDLSAEERPVFGEAVNAAKDAIESALAEARATLRRRAREADLASTFVDVTLPGRRPPRGALHPLRRVEREMLDVFRALGYSIALGPEAETDFHNFSALNFPDDHPARDTQDTFHLDDGRILRTHTSPVQVRTMLANEPPIRVAAPGAVYRSDAPDMTHSPNFHQVEGLVVDRGVTMADLKGTLSAFVSRLFGRDLQIRMRSSYFPFTEPSVEVDVECPFCDAGCRVCKDTRWIEILGAGMVDPAVFLSCGVDPEVYTGFAFGIGIERVAMLKYGVNDIRLFYENDVNFLAHFA